MLAALRQWQQRRRREGLNGSLSFTRQDLEQLERQDDPNANSPIDFRIFTAYRTLCAPLDTTSN
jgi:hypothetical protein